MRIQILHDEDQPRRPVLVRPCIEMNRRVYDVLDAVQHYRTTRIGDIEQSRDAKHLRTVAVQ